MSDTILKHDDLSPTQEGFIAGGVILLFGLLFWIFNYGMPNFGAYSGAVPAPVVLEADSGIATRPERIALNDAPASSADSSEKATPATTQQVTAETQTNTQQQMPAVSDNANAENAGEEQQMTVADSAAEADQSLAETDDKATDTADTTANTDNAEQQLAAVDDSADSSQQAEQVADSGAADADQQQADSVQAEQESQAEADKPTKIVIMDAAVAQLQDDLLKGEMEKPVVMDSITFASGSSELDLKSDHQIEAIAGLLQQNPGTRLLIRGHTDSAGPASENKELSLMRARAMGQKLVEAGVDSENIIIMGMGSAEPVSGNNTQQGQGKNRRIDVSITQ